MTVNPPDLVAFRTTVRAITGLPAADVGIAGDGAHQRTGGYHEGRGVLVQIGRYHAPPSARIGDAGEDYSARQERDRRGLSESASGVDVGAAWTTGRKVWQQWCYMLWLEMRDRPQNLPALRAINVMLPYDGKKVRYDQMHRADGLVPSTDSVDTHTHMEFWRDTEGRRQGTLDRIAQLMREATDLMVNHSGLDLSEMSTQSDAILEAWRVGAPKAPGVGDVEPVKWRIRDEQWQAGTTATLATVAADAKASRIAVQALAAVLDNLASVGGGSFDVAAVLAHMDQLAAADVERGQLLQQRVDELERELEQTRHAQHAAAQAAADATADQP